MAYVVLVSLEQIIGQILKNDQYSISLHVRQQIISIHKCLIFLQAFFEDFPDKANTVDGRIRDAANQAEDIIEYFLWGQIRSHSILMKSIIGPEKIPREDHPRGKHTRLCYDFNELEKVTKEIESIAGEVMDIKNTSGIKDMRTGNTPAAISSSRFAATHKKDAMVGFDDDLMAIKEWLCGESSKRQAIPIVGMGGIGKTTLARNAYDDQLIMEHFHILTWVTVSQDYSAQEVLSSILVSINPERSGQSNGSLEEIVYRSLKGRRYLIVLDDMWSTKVWDDLNMIFPNDNNGSRIMLTTRLSDVAAYPNFSSPLHEMRFMDAVQSWNLLQQKVFQHQDCPPELQNIGKTIASSCRGLPLAIIVIAGLLSTLAKTRASWREIAENVNSSVATKGGQLEEILSLSYTHVPHHLRPCFLNFGCFPEDYEIYASDLIKLWLAEGFLQQVALKVSKKLQKSIWRILRREVLFWSQKGSLMARSKVVASMIWCETCA